MQPEAAKSEIKVTLPDGKVIPVAPGTTVLQVAETISPNLARVAVAGKSGDRWLDLRFPLTEDLPLKIVRQQDPEGVEVIRHSAEHVMADAVKQLWPEVQVDAGRASHEEKFQYDFKGRRFTTDELQKISDKMAEIIKADVPFTREEVGREDAKKLFASMGEGLKDYRISKIPEGEAITVFRHGKFADLCRGPHVQRTGQIGAFKLLEVSGVYYLGDEQNEMLQRIYGTAFAKKADLEAWEKLQAEAEKRDHRKIGRELDLFSIQEEVGGGLVLWHPKGAMVRKLMEDYWRAEHLRRGYSLVNTPHVGRAQLWETSGHLGFYKQGMFRPMEFEDEEGEYYCKPMNCPFHIKIFANRKHSYRELPIRLAELGTVYRWERSGTLHGLMRVRGFTQDDSHIFCTPEQVENEIQDVVNFAMDLLRTFGFTEFTSYIATKPADSVGDEKMWDFAVESMKKAADKVGLKYQIDPGGGAFYGPKIDIRIKDAIGREWQCSTVQFDFNEPERFGLEYVGADNKPHRPYMVHRALYGSMERFFGVLIEHHEGRFPLWLAPVQAKVLPVSEKHEEYAAKVAAELTAAGVRNEIDRSNEKLGKKIAIGEHEKVPFLLVVGEKDAAAGTVSPRRGGKDQGATKTADFIAAVKDEVAKSMSVNTAG